MGKTERAVLAELLYYRYVLSQEVSDEDLLNKLLFDYEIKTKICTAIGIPKTRITQVLTKLRKENIVIGRSLNKHFIPEVEVGDKEFVMAYKFKLEDNEEGIYKKKIRKEAEANSEEE